MAGFDPRKLTWAALLGRWITFARSAVALPDDAHGRAWKAAVPDIIGLQAVAMALGELDQLPADERALGLDRAQILVDRHTRNLSTLFADDLHPMLRELIQEAQESLIAHRAAGP
jgi:hypothetical protein